MKKKLRLWVKIVIALVVITTLIILDGFFLNSHGFKVNEIALYENISDKYNGLKIVQISDIYYGNNVNKDDLKKIVKNINLIKPDIVFFTGDLMYKDNKDSTDVANILSKINTELGKYYITGDNDYNDDTVNDILNKSGFNSLNNKYELIYKDKDPILISGISTKKDKTNIEDKLKDTYEYLNNNSNYSILIMHEPNIIDKIEYEKFNLILAGHTKGGVSIYLPEHKILFSGDTLFESSIGRTDLPGSSHTEIITSVKDKLFVLPDDVSVFPGHGRPTKIGDEKIYNPYF